jgi:hypothetical protein
LSHNAKYVDWELDSGSATGNWSDDDVPDYDEVFTEIASSIISGCNVSQCVTKCSCNTSNGWYAGTKANTKHYYNVTTTRKYYNNGANSTVSCYKAKCSTGEYSDSKPSQTGFTFTGSGNCYSVACDTANGYTATKPTSGTYSTVTYTGSLTTYTCYKTKSCPTGYTTEQPNTSYFVTTRDTSSGLTCYMASGCNTGNGYYEALTSSDNSGLIDIESTTWVGSNGGGLFCGKCINGSSTTLSCPDGILASWYESAALKTKKCYKCHKPWLEKQTKVEYIDNDESWYEGDDSFSLSESESSSKLYTGSLSLAKLENGNCSAGGNCNGTLKITAYIAELTGTRCNNLSVNNPKTNTLSFNDTTEYCEITTTVNVTAPVQDAKTAANTYQYITVSVSEGSNTFNLKYTVIIPAASWK